MEKINGATKKELRDLVENDDNWKDLKIEEREDELWGQINYKISDKKINNGGVKIFYHSLGHMEKSEEDGEVYLFLKNKGIDPKELIFDIHDFDPNDEVMKSGLSGDAKKWVRKGLGDRILKKVVEKKAIERGARIMYCSTPRPFMEGLLVRNGFSKAYDKENKETGRVSSIYYKDLKKDEKKRK